MLGTSLSRDNLIIRTVVGLQLQKRGPNGRVKTPRGVGDVTTTPGPEIMQSMPDGGADFKKISRYFN